VSVIALAISIAALPAAPVSAQEVSPVRETRQGDVTLQELVLRDGSRLYGTVQKENADEVLFRTQAGTLVTARRADIASLRTVTGLVMDGEFERADPNATRLFFAPTGRTLEPGEVYLAVYEVMLPFVQAGLTERLSVGGGTLLIFGLENDWVRPYWITPKFQVMNTVSASVAVGVMQAFGGRESGGIAYGVGTFGRQDASLTAGAGIAYGSSGGRSAVLMLGGERRLRRNIKLVSENYIWKGGEGVASVGFRFFGERLSADLGLAMPLGTDYFFAAPVINFVYVFNRGGRQ
jgi:hypothetical protein